MDKYSLGDVLTAGALMLLLVVSLWLFKVWLVWLIWTAVVPQIWPDGPANIVDPGFWLFAGVLAILTAVGGLFKATVAK